MLVHLEFFGSARIDMSNYKKYDRVTWSWPAKPHEISIYVRLAILSVLRLDFIGAMSARVPHDHAVINKTFFLGDKFDPN